MRTILALVAVVVVGTVAGPAAAKTYKDPAWQLASLDANGPVKSSQVSKYQRPLKRVANLCHISRGRAADHVVTGWKLLKHRFTNYAVLKQFSHIDRATVKRIGCPQAFAATITIMRHGG